MRAYFSISGAELAVVIANLTTAIRILLDSLSEIYDAHLI